MHVIPKVKNEEGVTYRLKHDDRCKDDIEDFCVEASRRGGNYELLLCLQNQIKVLNLYTTFYSFRGFSFFMSNHKIIYSITVKYFMP